MILALALAFFAQTPAAAPAEPAPRIEDTAERRVFDEAQRALNADAGLLGLHRGLWAYVAAEDGLRQAEEGYDAVMELSRLRECVEDFEEVLIVDGDARADFERYAARLQRDSALRDALDGLGAVEMEAHSGTRELPGSFAYLRAHPQSAITFLMQREPAGAVVEALRPLREAFRRNTALQAQLREAWTKLDAQAGAREAVYSWWARAYGGSTAAAKRYLTLEVEFASFPAQRRAWETRELAWASRPESMTVAWRDHMYGRMRRDPVLGPIYFRYLHTLRTRPDVQKYAENAFSAKHGALPAWPPRGTPPGLAAWRRPESITKPNRPENPTTTPFDEPGSNRPERPTINRPTAPQKPIAPEHTQAPTAP